MDIREFKRRLHEGEVKFSYTEGDGSVRNARGTLNADLMPKAVPSTKFKCMHIVYETDGIEGTIPKPPRSVTVYVPNTELNGLAPDEIDQLVGDMLTDKLNFEIKSFDMEELKSKPPKKLRDDVVFYYDLDKQGGRSFVFEKLIKVEV